MTLQDDLEEAPARSRAAVHQQGPQAKRPARQAAGQLDQATDNLAAELIIAQHQPSPETLQVRHLAQCIEKCISL